MRPLHAKLLVWTLALVSALVQCDVHQCPRDTSSPFPKLSSDQVGALPSNQTPQRIKDLFDRAKRSSSLPIRFTRLAADADNTSEVEVTKKEIVISIAHELMHVILQSEGFAAVTRAPEGVPFIESLLGPTLTSCVDDAVVDRRLKKLGFNPEMLNHITAEDLPKVAHNYSAEILMDPIMRDGTALLIVCYSFRLRNPGDEIENTWAKVSTDVVARSHFLANRIGDITCNEAEECLKQKKHIRDVLGYPITICNPRTCEFE